VKAAALVVARAVGPHPHIEHLNAHHLNESRTMTSNTTTSPATAGHETTTSPSHRSGWAWAGVGAGLCGIALFMLAPSIADVPDAIYADNALLAAELDGGAPIVWAMQVLTGLAAVLLVVFGAGLRRRLAEHEPVGSLLPTIAFSGLLLTAALNLVGGGISTELFWSLTREVGETDPDTVISALTIFNTLPWVWAGAGLASGAVAVAALRHGSAPRWIGWTSVVLTALVVLTQVVPLQYLALAPVSLWLVIAGIGLARRERSS
jgi:hypothetical protein